MKSFKNIDFEYHIEALDRLRWGMNRVSHTAQVLFNEVDKDENVRIEDSDTEEVRENYSRLCSYIDSVLNQITFTALAIYRGDA